MPGSTTLAITTPDSFRENAALAKVAKAIRARIGKGVGRFDSESKSVG
jgi:hypothetical protein